MRNMFCIAGIALAGIAIALIHTGGDFVAASVAGLGGAVSVLVSVFYDNLYE